MKLLSLALGASLLAAPAFARPAPKPAAKPSATCNQGAIEVLTCSLEKPTRASKNVNIRKCRQNLVAVLSMPGMTDKPVEVASYFVKQMDAKAAAKRPVGGPVVYTGEGFNLSVNWTTTPVNGGHWGHLTAKAGGDKIDTKMVCRRTR